MSGILNFGVGDDDADASRVLSLNSNSRDSQRPRKGQRARNLTVVAKRPSNGKYMKGRTLLNSIVLLV